MLLIQWYIGLYEEDTVYSVEILANMLFDWIVSHGRAPALDFFRSE